MLNYYKYIYNVHFWVRQVVSYIHIKVYFCAFCARGDPSWDYVGRMRMLQIRACVLLSMRVVRVQRDHEFDDRERCAAMRIDVNRVIQSIVLQPCFRLFWNVFRRLSDLSRWERYLSFFCYNCFTSGCLRHMISLNIESMYIFLNVTIVKNLS